MDVSSDQRKNAGGDQRGQQAGGHVAQQYDHRGLQQRHLKQRGDGAAHPHARARHRQGHEQVQAQKLGGVRGEVLFAALLFIVHARALFLRAALQPRGEGPHRLDGQGVEPVQHRPKQQEDEGHRQVACGHRQQVREHRRHAQPQHHRHGVAALEGRHHAQQDGDYNLMDILLPNMWKYGTQMH